MRGFPNWGRENDSVLQPVLANWHVPLMSAHGCRESWQRKRTFGCEWTGGSSSFWGEWLDNVLTRLPRSLAVTKKWGQRNVLQDTGLWASGCRWPQRILQGGTWQVWLELPGPPGRAVSFSPVALDEEAKPWRPQVLLTLMRLEGPVQVQSRSSWIQNPGSSHEAPPPWKALESRWVGNSNMSNAFRRTWPWPLLNW